MISALLQLNFPFASAGGRNGGINFMKSTTDRGRWILPNEAPFLSDFGCYMEG
jgi:hypothetical protein